MKRILDTVHGYIMIEEHLFDSIIDTVYFQRLRRIEQTAIRSVYPSARHDRFIHSLGVFHIGSLIVNHLKQEAKDHDYWKKGESHIGILFEGYLIACLLHDIGHAPFSHTFEKYYGQKSTLSNQLSELINTEDFRKDLSNTESQSSPNYHEYVSAIVAYTIFKPRLNHIDFEFIVRMITGVPYIEKTKDHQFENCLISLLHGKIIDADRLDYACRDVWASGYCTSSIDLRRLISAIHIENYEKELRVCVESNALNEIDGLLNVKDFQGKYVINHHVVAYEQWLLKEAAKKMALNYFPNKENDGDIALGRLLNIDSIINKINVKDLIIKNISDDDLVFLMKQDENNTYYKEWASREYTRKALWKSPDEFRHFFPNIKRNDLKHKDFDKVVRDFLLGNGFKEEEIVILEIEFKPKVKMDELFLSVSKDVIRYTDIYPQSKEFNQNKYFYYVYVPCDDRKTLAKRLEPQLNNLYKDIDEIPIEALLPPNMLNN